MHQPGCYFFLAKISGLSSSRRIKWDIQTFFLHEAKLVPRGKRFPSPVPLAKWKKLSVVDEGGAVCVESPSAFSDSSCIPQSCQGSRLIEQSEFNDRVRHLNLSEQQTQSLGSRMQQWELLAEGTRIPCVEREVRDYLFLWCAEFPLCMSRYKWIDGGVFGCEHGASKFTAVIY
jgi:hypothetical protein